MDSANRTEVLHARCRPHKRELVEAAARTRRVHLSELVRKSAIREARRALMGDHDEKGGHGP